MVAITTTPGAFIYVLEDFKEDFVFDIMSGEAVFNSRPVDKIINWR